MGKRATVPTASIKEDFYVRQHTDDDHVIHLAGLIRDGVRLPPILVTYEAVVVDGRHRLHAHRLADKPGIEVEYIEDTDKGEIIARALRANIGGSLPPTNADIIYAITQMIEAGMAGSVITKQFQAVWPPAVVRRYYSEAQSQLTKNRIIRAKGAVLEGKTIQEAATLHKIKLETLKTAIQGSKKRKTDSAEIKGNLTAIFRSRGGKMGGVMKRITMRFEDGEISWKTVEMILDHLDGLCSQTSRSVKDWRKRLEAKAGRKRKEDAA